MGIKGLWKHLQEFVRTDHVSNYRGQRVGVDAYGWLHRALISSAVSLATGQPCGRFIAYMVHRVELLQRYGVTPVMVFDGAPMPVKEATDRERQAKRTEALEEGLRELANSSSAQAQKCLEKSIDVTPDLAYSVIQVLKERSIECIVAPYEADAQLGYLNRTGYVQAVISEDSDLIVHGCSVVLAKLDGAGNCESIHTRDIFSSPCYSTMTREMFTLACVLSGCDYLPSLHSIGPRTAFKIVHACRDVDAVILHLEAQGHLKPADSKAKDHRGGDGKGCGVESYREGVCRAFYAFEHPLVYAPRDAAIVHARPLPPSTPHAAAVVGPQWGPSEAAAVCAAHTADPTTRAAYADAFAASRGAYRRREAGGQRALAAFEGFEGKKAPRVVKSFGEGNAAAARGPHASSSSWGAPPRPVTVVGFYGVGNVPQRLQRRSKYFESTSSESTPEAASQAASTTDAGEGRESFEVSPTGGASCPMGRETCSGCHSVFEECRLSNSVSITHEAIAIDDSEEPPLKVSRKEKSGNASPAMQALELMRQLSHREPLRPLGLARPRGSHT